MSSMNLCNLAEALENCPYPVYSDSTRQIYSLLGMTHRTLDPGQKPAYTKHGIATSTILSMRRNMAMPLKNPGELSGLGGEFVFGPGRNECTFAHRMRHTRDHAELSDILKAIGIPLPRELHSSNAPRLNMPKNHSLARTPPSKLKKVRSKSPLDIEETS